MPPQIDKSIFLTAMESIKEGITIADPQLEDCPIIFANQGFYDMTGYKQEDVIGHNCRFLQGKDTDQQVASRLSRAVHEQKSCTVEILNYRKNGSAFWNRVSISPIHDDAQDTNYMVGIQTDITLERDQIEQQRQHIALMRKHGEDMNRSLRLISDDIQTCMKALHHAVDANNASVSRPSHLSDSLGSVVTSLNSNITLLATMLETNSNEILQYVKKKRQA